MRWSLVICLSAFAEFGAACDQYLNLDSVPNSFVDQNNHMTRVTGVLKNIYADTNEIIFRFNTLTVRHPSSSAQTQDYPCAAVSFRKNDQNVAFFQLIWAQVGSLPGKTVGLLPAVFHDVVFRPGYGEVAGLQPKIIVSDPTVQ